MHPMSNVFTRVAAAGLACSLFGATRGPGVAADADAQYAALAKAYYADDFRLNPIDATQVGVHDYDDQVGDFSVAGIAAQVAMDHTYLARLQTMDRSQLSPSVALDATLLENALRDDLLLTETLAQWRHDPDGYVQAASGAVFTVMSKDYAPLADRMEFAIARERLIPGILRAAEHNITTVDAVSNVSRPRTPPARSTSSRRRSRRRSRRFPTPCSRASSRALTPPRRIR